MDLKVKKKSKTSKKCLVKKQYTILTYNCAHLTLNKNSHILPTGQWCAPSAVINDSWYCMVLYGIAWYYMVLHYMLSSSTTNAIMQGHPCDPE